MIGRDEAMDILIEACPSYLAADDLHDFAQAFEQDGDPDPFVRAAAFAQHLVALVASDRLEEWPAVADAIDRLLVEGDPRTVDLVELGLIESLQNIVSHADVVVGAAQIECLLAGRGVRSWQERDELWAKAGVHAESTGPTEAEYERVDDPDLRLYFRANTRALPDGRLISTGDVLQQEQRTLEHLRERQQRAMRGWVISILAVVTVLLVAGYTLR
jgi:hypothetical protein